MILLSLFLFPLTYVYLLIQAGTLILHCLHSSVFFFVVFFFVLFVCLYFVLFFPEKGIYPVCDWVHLMLSFIMNLKKCTWSICRCQSLLMHTKGNVLEKNFPSLAHSTL